MNAQRFSRNILFLLLSMHFLVTQIFTEQPPLLISIGKDCEVANRLIEFKLRKEAYPFDGMQTYNFEGLCRLIENDFTDFLNPTYLVKRGISVVNTYYDLYFRHDFPVENTTTYIVVDNWIDYLPNVSGWLNRRIKRFVDAIHDPSRKIVFIRTNILPKQAERFVSIMHNKFPEANYVLAVVHHFKDLIGEWGIPHVINFYAHEFSTVPSHISQKWYHEDEWSKIFSFLLSDISMETKKEILKLVDDEKFCSCGTLC